MKNVVRILSYSLHDEWGKTILVLSQNPKNNEGVAAKKIILPLPKQFKDKSSKLV